MTKCRSHNCVDNRSDCVVMDTLAVASFLANARALL